MFLHLGTRRCSISPCALSPDSAWVSQQARNFVMEAEDLNLAPKYVMRNNDTKFTVQFDAAFYRAARRTSETHRCHRACGHMWSISSRA